MNRLQIELNRLYGVQTGAGTAFAPQAPSLVDPAGRVRALVMELAAPPDWKVLSRVWQGVQTEWGLPAPAIAIDGVDALQLWFSLAEPIEAARAHAFLQCLQQRSLADIDASRVRLWPACDTSATDPVVHVRPVPACQEQTGNWSAFLAPDLVPVFAETPWLDIPPNEEGQAALLLAVAAMEPGQFDAVLKKLMPAAEPLPAEGARPAGTSEALARGDSGATSPVAAEAQRFLRQVMLDDTAPLALRVEAAKALLQRGGDPRFSRLTS